MLAGGRDPPFKLLAKGKETKQDLPLHEKTMQFTIGYFEYTESSRGCMALNRWTSMGGSVLNPLSRETTYRLQDEWMDFEQHIRIQTRDRPSRHGPAFQGCTGKVHFPFECRLNITLVFKYRNRRKTYYKHTTRPTPPVRQRPPQVTIHQGLVFWPDILALCQYVRWQY